MRKSVSFFCKHVSIRVQNWPTCHWCRLLFVSLLLLTATRCLTGKQNQCRTSLIWHICPTTGVVTANQPDCKWIVIFLMPPKLWLQKHKNVSFFWKLFYQSKQQYWDTINICSLGFRYHHTGPVSGFFALRESLAILAERVKGHFIIFW